MVSPMRHLSAGSSRCMKKPDANVACNLCD
jgi:hypothetical protein